MAHIFGGSKKKWRTLFLARRLPPPFFFFEGYLKQLQAVISVAVNSASSKLWENWLFMGTGSSAITQIGIPQGNEMNIPFSVTGEKRRRNRKKVCVKWSDLPLCSCLLYGSNQNPEEEVVLHNSFFFFCCHYISRRGNVTATMNILSGFKSTRLSDTIAPQKCVRYQICEF